MKWFSWLGYLALPAAAIVHLWLGHDASGASKSWEPATTFILAGLAIIPLAGLMGHATEQLAARTGPTWGGLLNATFGNAAELIIGIVAIQRGLVEVAMASIVGSILGNLLLVAGAAMLAGGWRRERQSYSRPGAEANSGLLVVAVAGMLLPAIFHFSYASRDPELVRHEHGISIGTSIVLLAVYGLGLLFTLRTHRHIFSCEPTDDTRSSTLTGVWPTSRSVLLLFTVSAAVAVLSEWLVGSVEHAAAALHLNQIFVGVVVLAIIGNAAEHSTAVLLARRDDMDTAMSIVFQSSLQIALFVAPMLVLLSAAFVRTGLKDARQMDVAFSPLEVVSVFLSVGIIVILSRNGESNWFEGVLLLAIYAILCITFFYIPPAGSGGYDMDHGLTRERTGTTNAARN
jgi:Ca2+:H+ antiporter